MESPEPDLPTFDGNILEWTSFWETFRVNVDENPDLTDTRKFLYLTSVLRGEALQSVEYWPLTPENYRDAVDSLKKRYGKPFPIKSAHVRGLMSLPEVRSTRNIASLRKLYDDCQYHIDGLRALGESPEGYSPLLPIMLLPKLPRDLVLEFYRQHPGEERLNDLMTFFHTEIEIHERFLRLTLKPTELSSSQEQPSSTGSQPFVTEAIHLRSLVDLPAVNSMQNVKELRKFYDTCLCHVSGLKALNDHMKAYSTLLPIILFPKLPQDLVPRYHLSYHGEVCLEDLMNFLRQEVEILEFIFERSPETLASSSALLSRVRPSTSTGRGASDVKECPFCGSAAHHARSCPRPKAERRAALRANGCCFNCLRSGHMVSQCPVGHLHCRNCRGNHHIWICTQATEQPKAPGSSDQPQLENQAETSADSTQENSADPHTRKTVALQTATVVARGPNGKEFARCVFTSNNRYSYITKSLALRLGLKTLGVKHIYTQSIIAIGGPIRHRSPIHEFEISSVHAQDSSISLRVLQMSSICDLPYIPTESFATLIPSHCKPLADTMDLPIDIMIAGDYYNSLITHQSQRIRGGAGLVNSRLGWILSGPVPVELPNADPHSIVILTHNVWEVSSNSDSALSDGDDEEHNGSSGSDAGLAATDIVVFPPRNGCSSQLRGPNAGQQVRPQDKGPPGPKAF